MTLQSQLRSRKRQHNIDLAFNTLAVFACIVAVAVAIAMLAGCSSTSRTRFSPSSTNATHETRTERPGRTITSEYELEIMPPVSSPSGDRVESSPSGDEMGTPARAPTPAARRGQTQPDAFLPGGTGLQPGGVSGVVGPASLTPVAYAAVIAPEHAPHHDRDTIGEAIREAVANGYGVKLKAHDSEEIPLAAETSNSTLDDRGPGLETSSDEAAIGFDGGKGGASLPWGGKGGKTKWGLDASLVSQGVNALHIVGAIVIVGAIIPVISPPRRWVASGIVAMTGMLIIAAGTVSEQAPWVFVLAILAFLGVAGWLGYEAWRNKRRSVALNAIVKGVETDANGFTKGKIKQAAGDNIAVVKSEVNATKAKAKIAKTE